MMASKQLLSRRFAFALVLLAFVGAAAGADDGSPPEGCDASSVPSDVVGLMQTSLVQVRNSKAASSEADAAIPDITSIMKSANISNITNIVKNANVTDIVKNANVTDIKKHVPANPPSEEEDKGKVQPKDIIGDHSSEMKWSNDMKKKMWKQQFNQEETPVEEEQTSTENSTETPANTSSAASGTEAPAEDASWVGPVIVLCGCAAVLVFVFAAQR